MYDSLGRLESRVLSVPNLNTNYYYTNSDEDYSTSTQIKLITTPIEDFFYNYDAVGNITQMYKDMVLTESYTYDPFDQLLSATVNGKTYSYTYDGGGNILTANEDGTTHAYTYGNTAWKDQLTAYDGQTITYDAIGNPLTYRDGMSFTWQNGRQLASTTKNGVTTSYTYNGDGTRNTKTVDNTTTQYYYVNGRLQALTRDIYTAFFLYDDTGRPYAVRLTILPEGHTSPFFVKAYYKYNLQGDVVGLYNTSGQEFVTYTYDPWGKPLTATGMSTLIMINPFRYRGYVYDDDTGLYYCNSRYYDPETGRWINADSVISGVGGDLRAYNTFAYCFNNPVNYLDVQGNYPEHAVYWWTASMWWLTMIDGVLPIGDAIYGVGVLVTVLTPLVVAPLICIMAPDTTTTSDTTNDVETDSAEAETITQTTQQSSKHREFFPANPRMFKPRGLIRVEYAGSGNGRIFKWMDGNKIVYFEWDEDYNHGPHYHVLKAEWNGKHQGPHLNVGDAVPEPWNSMFFGG